MLTRAATLAHVRTCLMDDGIRKESRWAMRHLTGKRVLITGGAAGIGRKLAERFATAGAETLIADIHEEAAREAAASLNAAGHRASAYVLDVTEPAAILAMRDRVHRDGGPIDVLVNNAGVVFGGAFLEVPLDKHLATYRVNLLGLTAVTHAFLPDLIAQPDAHLVNIASASGFIGLPNGSTYAASKWAVIGFSESIRLELAVQGHRHVHTTIVCPSYVATGLFNGARAVRTTSMVNPERLAQLVLHAVLRNRLYVLTPWVVKVTPFLKGVLPRPLFDAVESVFGATSSMLGWRGHGEGTRA
jgi:all-trans-retinol dehydrogenase (NAD+)